MKDPYPHSHSNLHTGICSPASCFLPCRPAYSTMHLHEPKAAAWTEKHIFYSLHPPVCKMGIPSTEAPLPASTRPTSPPSTDPKHGSHHSSEKALSRLPGGAAGCLPGRGLDPSILPLSSSGFLTAPVDPPRPLLLGTGKESKSRQLKAEG